MNVIPVFNENDAILSAMPLLVRRCPARAPQAAVVTTIVRGLGLRRTAAHASHTDPATGCLLHLTANGYQPDRVVTPIKLLSCRQSVAV